jgi:hypothetical protein
VSIPACFLFPSDSQAYFPASPHYPGISFCHLPPDPLPPPKEVINGNIKTVTEYKIEEDGKKFKVRSKWTHRASAFVFRGSGGGVSVAETGPEALEALLSYSSSDCQNLQD